MRWDGSLGRYGSQRRPLASNSLKGFRGRQKRRGRSSIDLASLYSGDRDIELASVSADTTYSVPDTFPLYLAQAEIDDDFVMRSPAVGRATRHHRSIWHGFKLNRKGLRTVFCLFLIIGGVICLIVVVPVATYMKDQNQNKLSGEEKIAQHAYPKVMGATRTKMIDPETPQSAYTRTSINGERMKLVFSDEFNTDGRSFYENDDQFWQAQDLHYA